MMTAMMTMMMMMMMMMMPGGRVSAQPAAPWCAVLLRRRGL
jgi:hypothetical protein